MPELTFYGGVNEIGGNKILLEDGERRLLFDFGFPFKGNKQFYEEYLRPRGGAGLLDPLEMGLLPPLEGLYRRDLETPGLWQRFKSHPLYRKIEKIDAVLLSHAHADHLARHQYALCTPQTAALYQFRMGRQPVREMSYREPIEWGGLRLTTYPASRLSEGFAERVVARVSR